MGYKKGSGKPRKTFTALIFKKDGTYYRQDGIRTKKVFTKMLFQPWREIERIEWIDE